MGRAGTKVGLSDPAVLDGKAVAQQIKGTPGITGLSPLSVHSGEEVWHLDVGSSHPGGGEDVIFSPQGKPGGNKQAQNGEGRQLLSYNEFLECNPVGKRL